MKLTRSSGILLHPTSLPGRFGAGDLGPEAYRFADFLASARQRVWQVLPLGPTGFGDSPYQSLSAFAGNPLLVSLELLMQDGDLNEDDLAGCPPFPDRTLEYEWVFNYRAPLLKKASASFHSGASVARREQYDRFCRHNASWLDDYALFAALTEEHGLTHWNRWEPEIAVRRPQAIAWCNERFADEIAAQKYQQYQFFKQWFDLKAYCRDRGVAIMGDIPIFVAHHSADVWSQPNLYHLDSDGNPSVQSGVPPDYFSATGQLWGNPLYRWDVMAADGYSWWIERLRSTLDLVDIVRLDHFRAFEAYWEVPGQDTTAVHGHWVKAPGVALFEAVRNALGDVPIVAETLGVITPEVEALRERFGFPGMGILQFAFGVDAQAPDFMPHNFQRHFVVYTGTHDNDTTLGWWNNTNPANSTRSADSIRREREFTLKYLGTDGHEMNWTFIRTILASVANLAITPLQDVLGLGTEARMNLPATSTGNWRWRFSRDQVTPEIGDRLRELTEIYQRV